MIRFEGVTKTYDGQRRSALDDVSVDIDKGEFVFLVGASGSGKSTFLRLLLKEDNPTKGTIKVNDKTLNTMSKWQVPKLRRTMGCVFQDFRLLRNKTVAENVAFALEVINKPSRTIKRVVRPPATEPDWTADPGLSRMTPFLETKTVWHPIGI